MKFQPCGDRYIVKLIPKPKQESKIIVLDKPDEPELGPFKGEVVACGPGNGSTFKMQADVGDVVFFDNAREFTDKDWDVFEGLLLLQNGQIIGKEVE